MAEPSRQIEDYRRCTLEIYLLPRTSWLETLELQHRLVYEIGDEPGKRAALIVVEHNPMITVGRQGSHSHFRLEASEYASLGIDVRWTNRGGGCWIHGPGSFSINAVMPVRSESIGLAGYRAGLDAVLRQTVADLLPKGSPSLDDRGLTVAGRPIAGVGIAVKNGVAYHGGWINASLDPDWFGFVQVEPDNERSMTSLCRESRTPLRPDAVREAVLRHMVEIFGFGDYFLANAPRPARRPRRQIHARI